MHENGFLMKNGVGMHENELLSVGDTVNWRGGGGKYIPLPAKVENISLVNGGSNIESISWSLLSDRQVVVDLDNGHWAYGEQLEHYNGEKTT
jgi:hypothetical protein